MPSEIIVNSFDTIQMALFRHSVDKLTDEIIKQNSLPDNSAKIAILSTLIGGGLVLIGTVIDKLWTACRDRKKLLKELASRGNNIEMLLRNHYKELAMFKTHAQYWWFCTLNESDVSQAEINRQDHLKSQAYAREVERSIGQTIADYIGVIKQFELVSGKPLDDSSQLSVINGLKTRKANEYDKTLTYDKVKYELVESDEEKLRNDYYYNLHPFQQINKLMYDIAK